MLKLKDVSRRLSLKYAQQIPATMPSPSNGNEGVSIPKAPRVPVEFAEMSAPESDFEVKTPRLQDFEPMDSSELGEMPTITPDELAGNPVWKHQIIDAVTAMYHNHVTTAIYTHNVVQKVREAARPEQVASLKQEMKSTLEKSRTHAMMYARQMGKILESLD